MEYGIQMYSLRDITEYDMEAALKAAADMGYKKIEYAGFFDYTPEELIELMEKYGLTLSSTHNDLWELTEKYEETVRYHKALGNTKFIIGENLKTREALEQFIADVNRLSPMLRAEGIEIGYHNHHFEFLPNKDGICTFYELVERTDMFFEVDTYWVFVAGLNPAEVLERLGDRVKLIHLKDGDKNGEGKSLGSGEAPVEAARAKAIEMGLDIIVESEGLNPTGIEEVGRCMDFLKNLE